MKNTLLFFAILLSIETCFAQTHKIKVSNFQFSPSTVNAKVGDTILFVWKSGTHTTTSLTIPKNATPWDEPMTASNTKFKYVVTKKGTYNYDCTIHPVSMTGKIKVTAALDAGLSDFNISDENTKAVLSWQVNDNSKVAYFSLQRSSDGDNFTEIARIQPSALNKYSYTDESATANKYVYYQLELTDKNGEKELSGIKMFTAAQSNSKLITGISPNPLTKPGHLMLQFNADAAGKMRVQLFAQNGKFINATEMMADKGLNNGHFHLGDLAPGTYYIICTLGNRTEKHVILYQ